ncbi:isoprenoid biosynthesis glyoxalase ElbB [bacterium SCSIO 12643]|nr:isoprenoid biosynthesis glyoxalase ElbB [bacterium SCSIO 12643]
MKKIGLLLSGSGVYDGSEIQETVFALLAIHEQNADVLFMAPNIDQMHVVNHLTGEEMQETRNVLYESARIARGDIEDVANVNANDIDALVIPGGFGTAKNHTNWAVKGPDSVINDEVKRLINEVVDAKKPIAALCMGPTTVAKALEGTGKKALLTVGTDQEKSPYDISAISEGVKSVGMDVAMKTIREVSVDAEMNIVCAPCYMMEASVLEVRNNIKTAIDEMFKLVN